MTLKNIFSALAIAMCSTTANCAETWVRCDQCTYGQAQELAIAGGPGHKVFVHSALTGSGYAFHTQATNVGDECYVNRPGDEEGKKVPVRSGACQTVTTAEDVALNAKQIEYAGLVKEVYDYSGGTMKAILDVNGDDIPNLPSAGPVTTNPEGVTAYDVENNLIRRRDMGDAVFAFWHSQEHVFRKLDTFLDSMFDVQFFGSEAQIDIRVTLSDGSKVIYRLKLEEREAEFVKAVDPNRLPVMNSESRLDTYVGNMNFSDDRSAVNWLENAQHSGVEVVYVSGHIGQQVVCDWDGETLTCRQKYAD